MESGASRKRKNSPPNLPRLSKERLEELVEEATVDAYNESEQASGFFTMMEDNLILPFDTEVLGVSVTVEKVDMTDDDQIIAVCARPARSRRSQLLHFLCLLRPRKDGSGSPPIVTGGEGSNERIPIL